MKIPFGGEYNEIEVYWYRKSGSTYMYKFPERTSVISSLCAEDKKVQKKKFSSSSPTVSCMTCLIEFVSDL